MKSLSVKLVVLIAAGAIFYSSNSFAEIVVKYDRFKDRAVVQTAPKKTVGTDIQPALGLIGSYDGQTPTRPAGCTIVFSLRSPSWAYRHCHSLSCLADGSPVKLQPSEHDGRVGEGYVMEFISVVVPFSIVEQLSKCEKVEFKLCNTKFTLISQEREDLKTFVEAFLEKK